VDDSRISAAGRTVKCSNCGARWTALKDGAAETAPKPAAAPPKPLPTPTPVAVDDDLVVEGPSEPPVIPPVGKSRPAAQREAAGKVTIWAISAAVIVGLVAGLIIFRAQVVGIVPATQAAYAGLGLSVNRLGLVIEAVRIEPTFQGGRPVLAVTGAIRNVRDTAVTSPDLRISLLDKAGKPMVEKIAGPIDPNVPAGAIRHFAFAIVDPPAGFHDLEVAFDAMPKAAVARVAAPAPTPRAADAVPGGPAPVEARSLPPGSPDALPAHD